MAYIALDLETTGFNPEIDKPIEIGALRFEGDNVLGEFETLINPKIKIPEIISHITGITDQDVKNAPAFEEIKNKLTNFIGNDIIIGHNIQFDTAFLKQLGIALVNEEYDTHILASILLPTLPSYSLETITQILGIPHTRKHRAIGDASASKNLFLYLQKKLVSIDDKTLQAIKSCVEKSEWKLKKLFLELTAKPSPKKELKSEKQELAPQKAFSTQKDHPLSKKIIEKLESKSYLLSEAGPGTDRIKAYLSAAIEHFQKTQEKVCIAIQTHETHREIFEYKLPVSLSYLKTPRQYLSTNRLQTFLEKPFFLDHEISLLIKVLLWKEQTKTGDQEELSLTGREHTAWEEICCDTEDCIHHKKTNCCFLEAQKEAEKSDIILVNQSLLILESLIQKDLVPSYQHLLIDEAHHLENTIHRMETLQMHEERLRMPFTSLIKTNPAREFTNEINTILHKTDILFGLLGIFLEKYGEFNQAILLPELENTPEWQRVKSTAEGHAEIIQNFLSAHGNQIDKNVHSQIQKNITRQKILLIEKAPENTLTTIIQASDGAIIIKRTLADVEGTLSRYPFKEKKSVILISENISIRNSLAFFKKTWGLGEEFEELILPPIFKHLEKTRIITFEDIPQTDTEGFFTSCCEIIKKTILANQGKTGILFTTKRSLTAVFTKTAPTLKQKGFAVFAHDISGGKGKILENYKVDPDHSALFGSHYFFEKLNLNDLDINCLIMHRLPFEPPIEAVLKFQAKKFKNLFTEYQTPRAVLHFKQAISQILQANTEQRTLIVLDTRLIKKDYGKTFLEAIPEGIEILTVKAAELEKAIQACRIRTIIL